jgi:hypothetical protein
LVQARDAFRRLGEVATPNTRLDAVEADEMLRSFRDELGAVDLHANEVRVFSDYFEEVVDAARNEGLAGVASRADRGIGMLDQSRRQPDRGGNPWWKGLGFMIGVAAIFTLATLCSDPNLRPLYCPEWVRTLITLVGLAGAILAILC